MKRIVLVLIAFCLSQITYSQTNTFPASGNVGIGTTSPTSKLTLAGGGNFNPNSGSEVDYGGLNLTFRGENTAGSFDLGRIKLVQPNGYYVDGADMTFSVASGGTMNERLRIAKNGNVGIGTTMPRSKFDVIGAISGNSFLGIYETNLTRYNRVFLGADASGGYIQTDYSSGGSLDFRILRYNTECVRILGSNGYVGIGISNPVSLLHLNGRNEFRIGTDNSTGEYFSISKFDGGVAISSYEDATDANNGHGRIMFLNNGSKTTGLEKGGFIFKHIDGTVFLQIRNDGNVGIGTTTPQNKLDVAGTIRCTEVKVVALPWSDFVFHPTYKLRTLGEVEQFIKANNHLPEIPTESEVKQHGVGLGEMNAKLLQKIEELTLYMIEQNKKIERVEEQNNLLMKEVEQLKAK